MALARLVVSLLLVAWMIGILADAFAVPRNFALPSATKGVIRRETCGFQGNPDIYGLGIRLGVYCQWTSTILAKIFLRHTSAMDEVMNLDMVFIIAISVATFVLSANDPPTHVVEPLLLLYIWFGNWWIVTNTSMGLSSSITLFGLQSRLALNLGMAIYSVWFWFRGLHLFDVTPCGTFAFLFAKVSPYNRAATFFRILSISLVCIACSWFVAMFYGSIPLMRRAMRRIRLSIKYHSQAYELSVDRNRGQYHFWGLLSSCVGAYFTPLSKNQSIDAQRNAVAEAQDKLIRLAWRSFDVTALCYTVIGIELILVWNHISDVYSLKSTGQLIPFVISAGGLINIAHQIVLMYIFDSAFNPNYEAFRAQGGKWVRFKKDKIERRKSV